MTIDPLQEQIAQLDHAIAQLTRQRDALKVQQQKEQGDGPIPCPRCPQHFWTRNDMHSHHVVFHAKPLPQERLPHEIPTPSNGEVPDAPAE